MGLGPRTNTGFEGLRWLGRLGSASTGGLRGWRRRLMVGSSWLYLAVFLHQSWDWWRRIGNTIGCRRVNPHYSAWSGGGERHVFAIKVSVVYRARELLHRWTDLQSLEELTLVHMAAEKATHSVRPHRFSALKVTILSRMSFPHHF